jgi:hypothetical protein
MTAIQTTVIHSIVNPAFTLPRIMSYTQLYTSFPEMRLSLTSGYSHDARH